MLRSPPPRPHLHRRSALAVVTPRTTYITQQDHSAAFTMALAVRKKIASSKNPHRNHQRSPHACRTVTSQAARCLTVAPPLQCPCNTLRTLKIISRRRHIATSIPVQLDSSRKATAALCPLPPSLVDWPAFARSPTPLPRREDPERTQNIHIDKLAAQPEREPRTAVQGQNLKSQNAQKMAKDEKMSRPAPRTAAPAPRKSYCPPRKPDPTIGKRRRWPADHASTRKSDADRH
jgi:hypothetical protein